MTLTEVKELKKQTLETYAHVSGSKDSTILELCDMVILLKAENKRLRKVKNK